MAHRDFISFCGLVPEVRGETVIWTGVRDPRIDRLPQILWANGDPWREANLWLHERARTLHPKTVASNSKHISAYASWVEANDTTWYDFPVKEADRCLVRFRGHLLAERRAGRLKPSVVTARMRDVIRFYRWLCAARLIESEFPLWRDREVHIQITTGLLERTIVVTSSELAIPMRRGHTDAPEYGLLPVSEEEKMKILQVAASHAPIELFLMLQLGFYTGMRIGSVCDLKSDTFRRAVPAPFAPEDAWLIHIGPPANPPVHTKGDVEGHVCIPKFLFDQVMHYITSPRRSARVERAAPEDRGLVFLTRGGKPYQLPTSDRDESSVRNAMCSLRKAAEVNGLTLDHFRFHSTRVTFGCDAARLAMNTPGLDPVTFVGQLLFHSNRATTERYIAYELKRPVKSELADRYTREFLGLMTRTGAQVGATIH